jgi:hypothetical protein
MQLLNRTLLIVSISSSENIGLAPVFSAVTENPLEAL